MTACFYLEKYKYLIEQLVRCHDKSALEKKEEKIEPLKFPFTRLAMRQDYGFILVMFSQKLVLIFYFLYSDIATKI